MKPSTDAALLRALELFDQLVDLPAAQRQARLDALSAGDPALAAAVLRLLIADQRSSGVLDNGVDGIAHSLLTELSDALPTAHPALAAGMQIASFTLVRPLGVGGMGEVWLAQRRDGSFVQDVALKLLKRGMDSDEIARRFVRERRILAELNHPHIAGFIDGGVQADGRLYYAMEFVDGAPLTVHARERGLDVRARVQLLALVCDAVAHAQKHLVVHRDLKPSNVLVDAGGQPRVLDFGIAKLVGESVPETALTSAGMRLLSPAYAAPEQILDEPVSTATDVYALGMIAYELLTGVLPHQRSGHVGALAQQVRDERFAPPSSALRRDAQSGAVSGLATARAQRDIAGDLDVIVMTALQHEPARRYANAAALADDLRCWLDGRPIAARADTAGYRMRKFVGRHRLAVGSASAVLLALIAGLGAALWQAGIAREQAAIARAEASRAEQQSLAAVAATARVRRVKDFMMQTFVLADPLQRTDDAPTTVAAAFEDAVRRIDEELADDAELKVDLLDDFSEIRVNQGRFDEGRELNRRALELAEATYPGDHPAIAEALQNRAAIESMQGGDFVVAGRDLERAVAILEQHAEQSPTQLANALNGLATVYLQSNRVDQVMPLLQRSVALWRAAGPTQHDGLAAAVYNTGMVLHETGRSAEAMPYANEAAALISQLRGENSPQLIPILDLQSQIHYRLGDQAAVEATDDRRMQILDSTYPGPHPWKASLLTDIGFRLMRDDPAEAAATLEAAIAMLEELDSPLVLMPLRYRALVARKLGGYSEAKAWFDRAMAVCAARTHEHILCDVIRSNRAGVIARLGDGEQALREVDAAMASMRAKGADSDNEYAQALEARAAALQALGQHDAAIATQTDAIARYTTLYGEDHAEVARARRNLDELRSP